MSFDTVICRFSNSCMTRIKLMLGESLCKYWDITSKCLRTAINHSISINSEMGAFAFKIE